MGESMSNRAMRVIGTGSPASDTRPGFGLALWRDAGVGRIVREDFLQRICLDFGHGFGWSFYRLIRRRVCLALLSLRALPIGL